ncbi:MAG TPA: glycoside hydrolase family 2 TIM barrel-domain containing protein, partial [Planctomycetota bacterium]|nr:glycoside hydrolase family 2 TIM barrel-domain containing protein [Planctomycetota bacterium]
MVRTAVRKSAAIAGLLLALAAAACSPRQVANLDDPWTFHLGDVANAQQPAFDDSAWAAVTLPHTWNAFDGQDGGTPYTRGIGWYRRHVTLANSYSGKRVFITFKGADATAELFINGSSAGVHKGGYSAFTFDVTGLMAVGVDTVLAVKVNNAGDSNRLPLSGDFNQCGGIYRDVLLTSTSPVHITLTDYAGPGVYATPSNVSAASADLKVTVKLRNDTVALANVDVEVKVLDADGNTVLTSTLPQAVPGVSGLDSVHLMTLAAPHLWNGRADPYQYLVWARVLAAGKLLDEVTQPLGFRFYHVDPDTGFTLNGAPLDLHGASFHQDRINKGWAISDADQEEDVALVKEVGATFVRLAHYQHPQRTYELLDAAGIIAWSEIPYVNSTNNSAAFTDNARQQLRELIRQNYNHPSVFFWGMYNEIGDDATSEALVANLVALAHAEDATRPTTAATQEFQDSVPNAFKPDVIGVNKYAGWYHGSAGEIAGWADAYHAGHPTACFGVSEYGAGASINQHEDDPAPPSPGGPWHPEEYQNLFHEAYWAQLSARPFIWSKLVWNMF